MDALHLVSGRTTLIVEDTAHDYETTLAALNLYGPAVSPSRYIVVEDGIVDFQPLAKLFQWRSGVTQAIHDFIASDAGRDFCVDRYFETFGITQNLGGYLFRRPA